MKNRIISISLAVMLALSVSLIGCGGEGVPETTEYDLTISATAGGSTIPIDKTHTYEAGTVVNLVATAGAGYHFVNWTGDVGTIADVEDATTTVTMNGNYSITANFAPRYVLMIDSTDGGEVITPGKGSFTHDPGIVVDLVAEAEEGYQFINWTGDVSTIADVNAASTTVTIDGDCSIIANFAKEISNWHDLDAVRENLAGAYILMNDLDSATPGYEELAGPTAFQGKGWLPIGSAYTDPVTHEITRPAAPFAGNFDGQGYEIRNLLIYRPDEDAVGLFGCVDHGGIVRNLGAVNIEVSGHRCVGGLAGQNYGNIGNSYSTGSVSGQQSVGGLIGSNGEGTVSNSYSTVSVTGSYDVGGLVGTNGGGTVSDSYSAGEVRGEDSVGGLVGYSERGPVSNSYYSYDEVLINGKNVITIGALFRDDFAEWLANDRFLDVNERLSKEDSYYIISNVSDFKQLLSFGQDSSLKFRLQNDLDFSHEPDFYIPYLAGEFDGNCHRITNLSFGFDFISEVGSFGYLASSGHISGLGAANVNIAGASTIGALVGQNQGTVSDSYSIGSVIRGRNVGGLVGYNHGGTVSNSHYSYDQAFINGRKAVTIGALFKEDFDQWLANDRFLDINERVSQEDGYYLINDVSDFKQLLAFGQDGSLKFRLNSDVDLATQPSLYIPYLAADFDGNAHTIRNLTFNFDSICQLGLFGYLAHDAQVSQVDVEDIDISGSLFIGGVVGWNNGGTVCDCHCSGSVTGHSGIGGLVGINGGTVTNCCFAGSVTGGGNAGGLVGENFGPVGGSHSSGSVVGEGYVGGLVGCNEATVTNSYSSARVTGHAGVGGLIAFNSGAVSNCYSAGSVTGWNDVGGLAGVTDYEGAPSNSFWDIDMSGQAASAGGTGKTTIEMKNIDTFSGAGWNIVGVANPGSGNLAYIWNIVEGVTYPFLSWQSI